MAKFILFVAQDVVSIELIDTFLDDSIKMFTTETEEADGLILRREYWIALILENRP